MTTLAEYVDGLPNLSGSENLLQNAINEGKHQQVFLHQSRIDFATIRSACAVALHMHQPLIPAGGGDLGTAEVISNLQYMMEHRDIGDNHNAPVFLWCYKRMGTSFPSSSAKAGPRGSCWNTPARCFTACGTWAPTMSSTA